MHDMKQAVELQKRAFLALSYGSKSVTDRVLVYLKKVLRF